MLRRGFTPETLRRFRVGYDPAAKVEGVFKYGYTSVVLPYGLEAGYYQIRVLPHADGSERTLGDKPLRYRKPPESVAGPEPVFNAAALWHRRAVICCEGVLDAMSVEQVLSGSAYGSTVGCVALGGKEPARLLRLLEERASSAFLICLFDSDPPGLAAAAACRNQLDAIGYKNYVVLDSGEYLHGAKDANELLQTSPAMLADAVREMLSATRK